MNRFVTLTASTLSVVLTLALSAGNAVGETLKDLIGTWQYVSVTVDQGGNKIEPFGSNPTGTMIYDENGRFAIVLVRAGLPKFASDNRMQGTADEYTAIVKGSLAYFGTYTFNEADRTISVKVEGSTFPNWTGTEQKRTISISGDQMTLTNPTASGGGAATVILKRVKLTPRQI
jgi:hypothetical protein